MSTVVEMRLEKLDRNELRYSSRVAYIIAFFFTVLSTAIAEVCLWVSFTDSKMQIPYAAHLIISICGLMAGLLILYLINRKYWMDLRDGRKSIIVKVIQEKEKKVDYEAGSGRRMGRMKAFKSHSIIVENIRYRIPEGLWIQLEEGGKVAKHTTKQNDYLIKFDTLERSGIS